jgi:hypothetical protein
VLAVPIRNVPDEVIGWCETIKKKSGPFTKDDIEIVETFASVKPCASRDVAG